MRNLSRQNLRSFHRESGVPRTLTGQKAPSSSVKQSQIRVGKYKYDPKDELGKGYSSKVYKGTEILKPHKRYAIKVINLKSFQGNSLDMLQSEIDIHQSLEHPYIVKLNEVIKTSQNYYLVMEYCPHGNLSEYIAQKKHLTEPNALQIIHQIISAYKYLLSQGVIHRDIKPANILRTGNKWKVSDFGFAAKARLGFKDKMSVGTPLYMAPQSLKKNFYSYKADFFSIGIVLFEMIVGQTPHEANSEKELLEKKSTEIILPKVIKNPRVVQFLNKMCIISEAKRMNRHQFQNYDFGIIESLSPHSNSTSILLIKDLKPLTDESSLKNTNCVTEASSKFLHTQASSKQTWCGSPRGSSKQMSIQGSKHISSQQTSKLSKNPMISNQEILTIQLQFVHHHYFLIKNIDCLHLQTNIKSMLMLSLFKLVVKSMRLLCDKNQNYLCLPNWEEYLMCKLYQQLYSQLTLQSQKYQKQYLQFIKHNDIKVIRAVNRKFPQLCCNNPLTSKFYQNFKGFIGSAIKEHDAQISNLINQGETSIHDRFKALQSLYTVYRVTEIRSASSRSWLLGEKVSLLADYNSSKLTRSDYNHLKRLIKHV